MDVDPAQTQLAQSGLLCGCHSRSGRTIGIARPSLHLAEHHDSMSQKHKVDLTLATAPIAVENDIATVFVPPSCQVFAVGPKSPTTGRQPNCAVTGVAVLRVATLRC